MKKKIFLLLTMIFFALPVSMANAGPQDFTLVNESRSSICYVYISPSNSDDWEEDVLGADECLDPGESLKVSFNAGKQALWDLRVEDNNGNYEDYREFNLNRVSVITIKGNGQAAYR